ncbi:MAG: ABC transporter ATP-binding protein, partial [Deltaproteobacteria bacterium]|nr:ABC transporter ATP-binding protein [Deltaproteobacteria bacterium]
NGQRSAVTSQSSDNYLWALKDVSFEVKRGEVVGIIGRNGAGKSTLLRILSRITAPTEGEAEVFGRVGSLLEVGTGFHPELTGRENVYFNGAILGMKTKEIERKFDEIVAFAEVEKFIDTPVKHYSSGMYLRLAFSVAAHLQPEILLVDEVLTVGDIEFQRKCIGRMEEVAREGRTVVMVSHSMSTVKALCSKALLLRDGRIQALGAVDNVVAEYLSAKVDAAEKVLTDRDHQAGGGSAMRVRRIKLLNRVMNSFSVYWQQPITVSLELEVFEPVEDVSFGAAIRMADGAFVFLVYNDDGGQPRWNLEPGLYSVDFTLQNNLKPGLYTLHVGAYQRYIALKNFFAVDAVNIEVLGFTEQGSVPPAADPGLVRGVKSTFSYKRLDPRELPK